MSHQRYVLFVFVALAILLGLTVQAAVVSGFAQMAMPDNRLGGLVNTSTALSLVIGALSFAILIRWRKALAFTTEVVGELMKVTWPTRDETVKASTTVILTTLFTAGLLAFYDFIWKTVADWFLFTNPTQG